MTFCRDIHDTARADRALTPTHFGLRYYSPSLGRFINRDPIEEKGGRNLYAFVRNNAINRWDHLGMHEDGEDDFWDQRSGDQPRESRGSANALMAGGDYSDLILSLNAADHMARIAAYEAKLAALKTTEYVGFSFTRGGVSGGGASSNQTKPGNPNGQPTAQISTGSLAGDSNIILGLDSAIRAGFSFVELANSPLFNLTDPTKSAPGTFGEFVGSALNGFSQLGNSPTGSIVGFASPVGDALDIATLFAPRSTIGDRFIASGSLLMGLGPLPNVGPAIRAGSNELVTVRTYTNVVGREGISETGVLRADTWVTLPGEIPPHAGHLQIEELLEIRPGRGEYFIEFDVPASNLRIPENGPRTSGGALQFQLNEPVPVDPSTFRRPPGRPKGAGGTN